MHSQRSCHVLVFEAVMHSQCWQLSHISMFRWEGDQMFCLSCPSSTLVLGVMHSHLPVSCVYLSWTWTHIFGWLAPLLAGVIYSKWGYQGAGYLHMHVQRTSHHDVFCQVIIIFAGTSALTYISLAKQTVQTWVTAACYPYLFRIEIIICNLCIKGPERTSVRLLNVYI